MKKNIKLSTLLAALLFSLTALSALWAEDVTITQIDSSRLLSSQTVRLFLDINTRADGTTVAPADIKVAESADGKNFTDVRVRKVSLSANKDEGISFYFLLDNSGSMWDGLDGKPTAEAADMKITHAKKAVNEFIDSISVLDRAGLADFNTGYTVVSDISADTSGIPAALDRIQKPSRDEAYTELYGSIERALNGFGETGRRKVLIILSDGENFPLHPETSLAKPEDGINAANRDGITCYVVNFGNDRDSQVSRIALESGGLVFDARNADELLGIYTTIRSNILDEYALTYTAAMFPGDKRYVKVSLPGADKAQSVRYYYSGTVLGTNTVPPAPWYLLFIVIPLLSWLALIFFKLERETTEAGIRLLYGAAGMQTRAFTLTGSQTIIGGDTTADITIAGNPSMKGNAATILFDEAKQQYTIKANADLTVNNQPVKTKKLEPGDVINMAGTVIVFDNTTKINKK